MATSSVINRAAYRERLENEIQCGLSLNPITDPAPLACGHIYNKYALIQHAAAQIKAQGLIHNTLVHPTCPIPGCKREIVPLTPNASAHPLMSKVMEYQQNFADVEHPPVEIVDRDVADCADLITTPDLLEKFKQEKNKNNSYIQKCSSIFYLKLFPSLVGLGIPTSYPMRYLSHYDEADCRFFYIQVADKVFDIRLDKENHFDITSVSNATMKEYLSYIKKNGLIEEEIERRGKFIITAAIIAGFSYYLNPFWGMAVYSNSLLGTRKTLITTICLGLVASYIPYPNANVLVAGAAAIFPILATIRMAYNRINNG